MARKGFQESDASLGGKRAALTDYSASVPGFAEEAQAGFQWQGRKAARPQEEAPSAVLPEVSSEDSPEASSEALTQGLAVLKDRVKTLKSGPGVYRMLDAAGDPLYIGKAKNLIRRVTAYTQISRLPTRLLHMVAQTRDLEVIATKTDVEALLLESNLIKRFAPPYNVLLRDDKSFPYILLTEDHAFAHLKMHRGAHRQAGAYFGPFASAGLVKRTVNAMEKAFLLRTCSNHTFATRQRPCLKYQIKRCSAPCVGKISPEAYGTLVADAQNFLAGDSRKVADDLSAQMAQAAERLDFEQAARLRDRLRALSAIQMGQDVNVQGVLTDADVIAISDQEGPACVQVFFYRAGRNYGNKAYFPRHDRDQSPTQILSSFVGQFYDDRPVPPLILLSQDLEERALTAAACTQKAGYRVELAVPKRGRKFDLVRAALTNANETLERRQAETSAQRKLLASLARVFDLPAVPQRIEVYDNSHNQGAGSIGAMIVAGSEGFMKNAYRKFNIKEARLFGDDFGMMRELFSRRFARAQREDPERTKGQWPDLVLIDGGKGQLSAVEGTLAELGIADVPLIAVAKGPDRNAGRETFYCGGALPRRETMLPPRDAVLYLIQRLRDEAHRFAIGTHRARRGKDLVKSELDSIPGVGAKRKRALLMHFGSARSVARAPVEDLMKVEGLNRATAQKIYDWFHGEP